MLTRPDPRALSGATHDLLVVGAGISGIMTALEACRRGLRPLLLERDDFGAATSHNSLRIVHGGLRYLQKADLKRHLQSTRERRWYLRHFPDLVHPLACLLPLYGKGLQRAPVLRAALAANDILSFQRNTGVATAARLDSGRVLSAAEALAACPQLEPTGLEGAALWYDGFAPNFPRLLIEALHWACAEGAQVLNHCPAIGLETAGGRVTGLRALDKRSGSEVAFHAPLVVNTSGPWADRFNAACGQTKTQVFQPRLAWNLVFDRPQLCAQALAVSDPARGGQVLFLVPWKGALAVGTGYAPWPHGPDRPAVSAELLRRFLDEVNAALPGLDLAADQVSRVYAGLLPARRDDPAELSDRPILLDHSREGGPWGLFTACEVKFTTARSLAEDLLQRLFPGHAARADEDFQRPKRLVPPDYPYFELPEAEDDAWKAPLRRAIAEEAPQSLGDLLLRRSSLGDNPARALALAEDAGKLFDWPQARLAEEIACLKKTLDLQQKT